MHIILSYKYTPYIKKAYNNYFTNSLNTSTGKTLVSNFSILFTHPSAGGKPYYNSSLFLNRSINPTSNNL